MRGGVLNARSETDRKEKTRADRRDNRRVVITHAKKAGADRRGVGRNDVAYCGGRKGGIGNVYNKKPISTNMGKTY